MDAFLEPLALDSGTVSSLAVEFSKQYRHLALNSTDQFLATPINVLPRGSETGRFLAIDVGGSNLRVGFVELLGAEPGTHGNKIRRTYEKSWSIEDHFKRDKAEELFSWIGSCIASVVSECMDDLRAQGEGPHPFGEVIPLGITFSFPMMQASISEATLMPMGKGFAITSDLNLGKMLLAGYSLHIQNAGLALNGGRKRKQSSVSLPELEIAAITNDTVATLASLAYSARAMQSSRVAMGLIVGTGTNATICMMLKDLHETKRESIILPPGSDIENASVVVNTEWTIKGAAPPLRKLELITKWDEELDENCDAPGFQPFEYMTAGRYLGELARLIVYDYLVNTKSVDPKDLPPSLCHRNGISTPFLSNDIAEADSATALLPKLQEALPPPDTTTWDWDEEAAELFLAAAEKLQLRSAKMIAAAVVGLLASAGELKWKDSISTDKLADEREPCDEVIVAYTGSVISSYPDFLDTCQATIDELVESLTQTDRVHRVVLRDASSGGLIGAGVLAGTVWNLPRSQTG